MLSLPLSEWTALCGTSRHWLCMSSHQWRGQSLQSYMRQRDGPETCGWLIYTELTQKKHPVTSQYLTDPLGRYCTLLISSTNFHTEICFMWTGKEMTTMVFFVTYWMWNGQVYSLKETSVFLDYPPSSVTYQFHLDVIIWGCTAHLTEYSIYWVGHKAKAETVPVRPKPLLYR